MTRRLVHTAGGLVFAGLLLLAGATLAKGANYRVVEETGKGTVYAQLGTMKAGVMQEFRLGFLNGDHKLRIIGLGPAGDRSISALLQDKDDRDPFRMYARYAQAKHSTIGRLQKKCSGTCTLPIKSRPTARHELALVGFRFFRDKGDANVKVIALEPTPDEHAYRVEFRGQRRFPYTAMVSYAWFVPSSPKAKPRKLTGRRRASKRTRKIPLGAISKAQHALQGFRASYSSGDHHLRDIGFFRVGSIFYAQLNDNNYDDPVRVGVNVVPL